MDAKTKWNEMTEQERTDWLRSTDPTMKLKDWAPLVARMAASDFDNLTALQQEMVAGRLEV